MPVPCSICEGAVMPTTPSLKCSVGVCKKYFHVKCLNLSDPDLTKFVVIKEPWTCSKCLVSNETATLPQIELLIKNQFEVLKLELFKKMDEHFIQIDNRVTAVENDIKLLKDEIAHVRNMGEASTNSNCVDDMLEEIEERKERACNVLLFNIPESLASTSNDKINDDLKVIEDILTPLGTFPKPKKIFRLGISKANHNRPLKIVYENENDAREILRSNKSNNNRYRHFRPDLTTKQREHINIVKKELKDRAAKGESNLILRYRHSTPYIIKNNTSRKTRSSKN